METISIVGAGIMGTDLAHLAASSSFNVNIYDIDEQKLTQSNQKIQNRLNRYVNQGRITHDRVGEIRSKLKFHKKIEDITSANYIVECVTENLKIKRDIFRKLDSLCKPGTVLATNTSSISITSIASATTRPESVIGIHFLNPVRVLNLVEIIPGFSTTQETIEMVKTLLKTLNKKYVVSKDFPGFMLNRMLFPMINEAIFLLYEGSGSAESIDKVMKLGMSLKMGPLELADMLGLDVVLAVAEEMYKGYSDPKYRPCPLLKKYVAAGHLGKKTGRGFYIY
jgi:3-hydroxybutyryl-CoA dehydrogenase